MPLPDPNLLFQLFQIEALTEGAARARFQQLITDLVRVQHEITDTVANPNGSDWGIDALVGRFDETMTVWQAKFFLDGVGPSQQRQIRDSFTQVCEQAKAHGFTVDAWILAVPCVMTPEERRWFDGWAGRQAKRTGILIKLWGGTELRHQLMRADAAHVRREYFATVPGMDDDPEPVSTTDDLAAFDDALFVRQLHEAGMIETDAARGLFFAADALIRDLEARGDKGSRDAVDELHLEIRFLWEQHFNRHSPTADAAGRMIGLVDDVLSGAAQVTDPAPLKLRPAHRRGVAHRLVEIAQAGWVVHWRDVAETHRAMAGDAGAEVDA